MELRRKNTLKKSTKQANMGGARAPAFHHPDKLSWGLKMGKSE